jgi:ribonucleotide monophosphatase NagD (HAD superfamily)
MSEPRLITGLSEIAPDHDALICDIWGVVHNGQAPFPEAAEALRRFRKERGRVVLLSNAPRMPDSVEEHFRRRHRFL